MTTILDAQGTVERVALHALGTLKDVVGLAAVGQAEFHADDYERLNRLGLNAVIAELGKSDDLMKRIDLYIRTLVEGKLIAPTKLHDEIRDRARGPEPPEETREEKMKRYGVSEEECVQREGDQ